MIIAENLDVRSYKLLSKDEISKRNKTISSMIVSYLRAQGKEAKYADVQKYLLNIGLNPEDIDYIIWDCFNNDLIDMPVSGSILTVKGFGPSDALAMEMMVSLYGKDPDYWDHNDPYDPLVMWQPYDSDLRDMDAETQARMLDKMKHYLVMILRDHNGTLELDDLASKTIRILNIRKEEFDILLKESLYQIIDMDEEETVFLL